MRPPEADISFAAADGVLSAIHQSRPDSLQDQPLYLPPPYTTFPQQNTDKTRDNTGPESFLLKIVPPCNDRLSMFAVIYYSVRTNAD